MMEKKALFITNWAQGDALSGGDRIWIELFKRWGTKLSISFVCSEEAIAMGRKLRAHDLRCVAVLPALKSASPVRNLWRRTLESLRTVPDAKKFDIVYSSSDFWPDALPAFLMRLKKKNVVWIAGFYLFAPAPWKKDSPYKGGRFIIGLFYWITQLPVYWIVRKYADFVFVTSEPDVKRFITGKRGKEKVIVVRGGVDITAATGYLNSGTVIPGNRRKYDAVFMGRFHYQKGVLVLVDIWKLVCEKRPQAKLVLIGTGPLEAEVWAKIKGYGLAGNIELTGFLQGQDAYEIFKQSRIVVHPATYDSGGMASAEAMAWALPGVSFDLESLKSYYPRGMLKTACFTLEEFADNITRLLVDEELYQRMGRQAAELIRDEWDWDKRAQSIFESLGAYTR